MAQKKVDTSDVKLSDVPGVADTKLLKKDNVGAAASEDMEASGAFMEPDIKTRIDVDHPAVDNEPRKDQPVVSNLIDFNDPTLSDEEAVAENLKNSD